MPRVTVPQNMTPRNLTAAVRGPALCQASPDGDAGCPPAAWVNVVITPVQGAGGPLSQVTADSAGQYLHCLFRFAKPQIDASKRRATELNSFLSTLDPKTGGAAALEVETDPGCYWIGTPCDLSFIGGTPGDVYDYSIQFVCVKQQRSQCMNVDLMEPSFAFSLTSLFYPIEDDGAPTYTNFPAPPQYHTHFWIVQGSARIPLGATNFVPLDASYGAGARFPLNSTANGLLVGAGIYQTGGSF